MSKVHRQTVTVKVRTKGNATVTVKVNARAKQAKPQGKLRFTNGNAKLDQAIFIFSLPAGHFCPFADQCRSRADRVSGQITDGPNTEFRCYAASSESRGVPV